MANSEFDLRRWLAWTASVVDHDGFVSKASVGRMNAKRRLRTTAALPETPTFKKVLNFLRPEGDCDRYPFLAESRRREADKYAPTEAHYEEASACIKWAESVLDDPGVNINSFLSNIGTIAKLGKVPEKLAGLACAMLAEYRKHLKTLAQTQLDTPHTSS